MIELVLTNKYFEFNGKVKQQMSGNAIGTKFAPTFTLIFMDRLEGEFLKLQEFNLLVWHNYIDDLFFI